MTHPDLCPDCDSALLQRNGQPMGDNILGTICSQCHTHVVRAPGGAWHVLTGMRGTRAESAEVKLDFTRGLLSEDGQVEGICLGCCGLFPLFDLRPMSVGVFVPIMVETLEVCPVTHITTHHRKRSMRPEITKGLGCKDCQRVASWWWVMRGSSWVNLKPRKADRGVCPLFKDRYGVMHGPHHFIDLPDLGSVDCLDNPSARLRGKSHGRRL